MLSQVKSFLVEMNVGEQTAAGLEKNGVNGKQFAAGLTMDALREFASKGDIQVLVQSCLYVFSSNLVDCMALLLVD